MSNKEFELLLFKFLLEKRKEKEEIELNENGFIEKKENIFILNYKWRIFFKSNKKLKKILNYIYTDSFTEEDNKLFLFLNLCINIYIKLFKDLYLLLKYSLLFLISICLFVYIFYSSFILEELLFSYNYFLIISMFYLFFIRNINNYKFFTFLFIIISFFNVNIFDNLILNIREKVIFQKIIPVRLKENYDYLLEERKNSMIKYLFENKLDLENEIINYVYNKKYKDFPAITEEEFNKRKEQLLQLNIDKENLFKEDVNKEDFYSKIK